MNLKEASVHRLDLPLDTPAILNGDYETIRDYLAPIAGMADCWYTVWVKTLGRYIPPSMFLESYPSTEKKEIMDTINHPSHYNQYQGLEIIDLVEQMNFNRGNAVKYIARAGFKDPEKELEDLKKAHWYIGREIQRLSKTTPVIYPGATDEEVSSKFAYIPSNCPTCQRVWKKNKHDYVVDINNNLVTCVYCGKVTDCRMLRKLES